MLLQSIAHTQIVHHILRAMNREKKYEIMSHVLQKVGDRGIFIDLALKITTCTLNAPIRPRFKNLKRKRPTMSGSILGIGIQKLRVIRQCGRDLKIIIPTKRY